MRVWCAQGHPMPHAASDLPITVMCPIPCHIVCKGRKERNGVAGGKTTPRRASPPPQLCRGYNSLNLMSRTKHRKIAPQLGVLQFSGLFSRYYPPPPPSAPVPTPPPPPRAL